MDLNEYEGIKSMNFLLDAVLSSINPTEAIENINFNMLQGNINWDRIISVIMALITILSVYTAWRVSKRDGITQHRVEWINKVRELTVKILKYQYRASRTKEEIESANAELFEAVNLLFTHLNVSGRFDRVIIGYLTEILLYKQSVGGDSKQSKFIENKQKLTLTMQIYLKSEWERVKIENKIFYCCYNEKRKIKKIIDKLDNNDLTLMDIINRYKDSLNEKKLKPMFLPKEVYGSAYVTVSSHTYAAGIAIHSPTITAENNANIIPSDKTP